ncbi:DUF3833 family protein [Rhizobium sp. CFBP 8762]|uniref:DUF3833 family protein n=1 Tax=Rhizobium sp. CFBP 8762 TaxID=2775279 RepID=UPI00177EAE89|nr:DUF3833 family protein [Rhizobium sp. CFBP 8762]MBD8554349.1 DUF3833 family protein [Rhizobium sp. CFBP 8762]
MKISDFDNKTPKLVLEEFFQGQLEGWGVTLSRFGAFQNQFKISAEGRWDAAANTLALKEIYTFDDGHTDTLTWTIIKRDGGTYEGRETRIEGIAAGEQAGNAFRWQYSRDVPDADGQTSKLGFDDWFWLQQPDVLVAHASLTKLGVEIATMNVFHRKL